MFPVFTIIFYFLFFTDDRVYAESLKLQGDLSEKEIMKIHEDLDGILSLNHGLFIQDGLRTIGFGIIKTLGWILDFFEKGIDAIISFGGQFYASDGVSRIIDKLMPFIMGLFLLTLIVVGILLMLNKIDKRENLILNVLLAVSMLVIIPNVFPELDKLMNDGIKHIEEGDSLLDAITKQNIADLNMYIEKDFKYGGEGGLPQPKHPYKKDVGTEDMTGANRIEDLKFSPTETLDMYEGDRSWWFNSEELEDFKVKHGNAYDILITRTDFDGDGDKKKLRKLRKNMIPGTEVARQSYYRYAVNWGTIIATLAVLVFASAITVIKMSRIIFDLGFHMIFSLFVAVTDITGGQRIKKMLTEIFSSFAVFFVMVLILRLFVMYANWLIGIKPEVGTISYLLMLLGGAWALLDAPDIVQRLLGIDAGLRSGWQTMAGAYAGTKALGGVGKGIGKGVSGMQKGAKGALAFGKGLAGRPPKRSSGSSSNGSYGSEGGLGGYGESEGGYGADGLGSEYPRNDGTLQGNDMQYENSKSGSGGKGSSLLSKSQDNKKNRRSPLSNLTFSRSGETLNNTNGSIDGSVDNSKTEAGSIIPDRPSTRNNGQPLSSSKGAGTQNHDSISLGDSGSYSPYGDSGILLPDRSIAEMDSKAPLNDTSSKSSVNMGGLSSDSGSSVSPSGSGTPNKSVPTTVKAASKKFNRSGSTVNKRSSPSFVSTSPDESNPFFKPTVLGGSRRGQESASFQARAYNTGLKWRSAGGKTKRATRDFKESIKDVSVDFTSASRPEKDIRIYNRRK